MKQANLVTRSRGILLAAAVLACSCRMNAAVSAKAPQRKAAQAASTITGKSLMVSVDAGGAYSISQVHAANIVLRSTVEANVNNALLQSPSYPQHKIAKAEFHDDFGSGNMLTVTHTGLPGKPDLVTTLRLYRDQTWGDVTVQVVNTTASPITVRSIRILQATGSAIAGSAIVDLNAPASEDRVISDSFSEDRPQMAIRNLGDAPEGVLRATGSQLIYNRKSGESLFLGALTSDKMVTMFHMKEAGKGADAKLLSYEAASTGTTEVLKEESLKNSPPAEQVELTLSVAAGDSLSSERVMFDVGHDYHAQLEQYGRAIKLLHHARVSAPTPIGWWSWTAYYFGLNEGAAISNAKWLAENLKSSGYTYYQIDEGYQYARGEYGTVDATLFPHGMRYVADKVRADGITFGVWTAPFEVSERAWVYQNHKDWLLHNAAGDLIHIGSVSQKLDPIYALDTTNPGAQEYLRQTYKTLHDWGVRFIKMDFMDDSAVEGAYFKPNTTALEAQRIGLGIIRETMGDETILDKDGSVMLNPVGLVDAGRISQDTGHAFRSARNAASGIAARYYMNRNYFIADPDAFTVSAKVVDETSRRGPTVPMSLDEAKVSIALAAVAGGMFEEGDDLPLLASQPERVALIKNQELIDMARFGHSSFPVDLLTYAESDLQPSIFLLKEDKRQAILTVFNWTDSPITRSLKFSDLGLKGTSQYAISEIFGAQSKASADGIAFDQPAHSVRVFKLVDTAVASTPPSLEIHADPETKAGQSLNFTASSSDEPALAVHWDFGDGTSEDGMQATHAFTKAGEYTVHATATGFEGVTSSQAVTVKVTGVISRTFAPASKKRFQQ